MIFGSGPGRLLREKWKNPVDLARELYAMATSKEERVIQAPVTIQVERGKTALKLVRQPSTPSTQGTETVRIKERQAEVRREITQRREADFQPPPGKPTVGLPEASTPTPAPTAYERGPGPTIPDARRPSRPEPLDQTLSRTPGQVKPQAPRPPDNALSGSSTRPGKLGREVPFGDPERASDLKVGGRSFTPAEFAKPYEAPLFEVDGEVRFSGREPVQFESAPLVFRAETSTYEPISLDSHTTDIPMRGAGSGGGLLGKVTGGEPGGPWNVDLYPDGPNEPAGDNVEVTPLNLHEEETPPVGQWIAGILQFDGSSDAPSYCHAPAVWQE